MSAPRLLGAVALALLAFAPSAQAQAQDEGSLPRSPLQAVVGEAITFDSTLTSDCAALIRYTVDGVQGPETSDLRATLTTSFATAGSHTVSASIRTPPEANGCQGLTDVQTTTFTVLEPVEGTITLDPEDPEPGETVVVTASQTGGVPGFTHEWDTDGDGAFDDATGFRIALQFPAAGTYPVAVRIRDAAPNRHEDVATRVITVATPPPPPPTDTVTQTTPTQSPTTTATETPTTPAPTTATGTPTTPTPTTPAPSAPVVVAVPVAADCLRRLDFELAVITTTGCFEQQRINPSVWTTQSEVKLNGIVFPAFGQVFTVTGPSADEPGGRFEAPGSTIQLLGLKVFSGDLDWTLPAGKPGEEALVEELTVALGATLFGLNVRGTIGARIGREADGKPYATFPLTIALPAGVETAPNRGGSSATGSAALKIDEDGPKFGGLKVRATNVWIGKVKLVEVCFSFVPGGSTAVATCEAPIIDGKPYITCAEDSGTDRWNGTGVIELPSGSKPRIAVFGGLAGGRLASLGGAVDNLGRTVPIGPKVFLDRVAVGLCLSPPPLKIRGTVGVGILPTPATTTVGINGNVLYDDGEPGRAWTLDIGGSVKVLGTDVGEGGVTIRSYGGIDFRLAAGLSIEDFVSVNGSISGWVDIPRSTFSIDGSVRACIDKLCAEGTGTISSVGVAGCITLVSEYESLDLLVTFDPFRVRFAKTTLVLTTGFGYRWGESWPSVFAGSCNFAPYRPVREFRSAQAGGPLTTKIARGTTAVSLRVRGDRGVPKVRLRGPDGTVVTSPAGAERSAQRPGRYALVESRGENSVNVVLVRPAAGTWTVEALPGSPAKPVALDAAAAEAPPTLEGRVRGTGDRRTVDLVYAVPEGASVRLVERAKGIGRTIARSVRGTRCAAGPAERPGSDQAVRCVSVPFTPSRGPGGTRRIEAVVTRGGLPLATQDVTTFRAPAQRRPARPAALRLHRNNGFVVVGLPRARGASRLAVTAELSDGRVLGFDLPRSCQQLQIPRVRATTGARITVVGVRYDLVTGDGRSALLKPGASAVGPERGVPRRQWRPRKACR